MVNNPRWDKSTAEAKYLEMSSAFSGGYSEVKGNLRTFRGKKLGPGGIEFVQKYRDLIESEAHRIYQEKLNMQGGQFDYTSPPEGQPEPTNTNTTPEF